MHVGVARGIIQGTRHGRFTISRVEKSTVWANPSSVNTRCAVTIVRFRPAAFKRAILVDRDGQSRAVSGICDAKMVYGDTSETVMWLALGQLEDVATLPE